MLACSVPAFGLGTYAMFEGARYGAPMMAIAALGAAVALIARRRLLSVR
jgi:hypothetical protein